VDKIAALNSFSDSGLVYELYGSLPYSLTGSGREGEYLPKVDKNEFEEHVCHVRSRNFDFNYTMNAPDLLGKEHDKEWLSALREHLTYLRLSGVNRLTIANDFLMQLILREFPEFRVNVSVIAGVDTPEDAEMYEQMGVECINLNQHTVNRDFETLGAIRQRVGCKLELICNPACVDHCPRREAHYKVTGHLSQTGMSEQEYVRAKKFADDCTAWCMTKWLLNPAELLKMPFIRPEDIHEYESMGIDIMKIEGRPRDTDWLTEVAKIYLEQSYDGNILYLTVMPFMKKYLCLIMKNPEQYALPLSVDNRKLGTYDFIENIKQLSGKEIENYYTSLVGEVISGYDHPDIRMIQQNLTR